MKQLLNIDLISVNCVNPEQSVKALLYSSEKIKFGSIKLFSHYKPNNITSHIDYIKIKKLSHEEMNWFHLNELPKYITNEFMLSIHDDGFIINPDKWDNIFLNYDYIGAPWPALDWCRKNRVGNGGFVLKSKNFLNLEEKLPFTTNHNDVVVTNQYYDFFIENGCNYAPLETACKFSLEHLIPESNKNLDYTFGFHGKLTKQHMNKIKLLEKYE
jgi:hypothetical protein